MEEDILNYLYQLSCFVGHPVPLISQTQTIISNRIHSLKYQRFITSGYKDQGTKKKHLRYKKLFPLTF